MLNTERVGGDLVEYEFYASLKARENNKTPNVEYQHGTVRGKEVLVTPQ